MKPLPAAWLASSFDRALDRRTFLGCAVAATVASILTPVAWAGTARRRKPYVMTVCGPVFAQKLGFTLSHEHVLVDFIGADKIVAGRYEMEEAFGCILPHLEEARQLGCRGFVECTPAYLGRDPVLLKRLANATGLHILTNTGYYGAAENKFLPAHAFNESADQLTARWVAEWDQGIDGTGIRPGFIKIGVGGEALPETHRKLVRAAARTHLKTGLTIASHTGPARLALEQLAILREEGVSASAFIWVHAQVEQDQAQVLKVAEQGCWVSFDGSSESETSRYLEAIGRFQKDGRLTQLLLSHDAGWYRPGERRGGEFRPYEALFRVLIPRLKQAELGPAKIKQVFERNPARAFAIGVRRT